MRIEIGDAGQVRRAKVEESTIEDPQLEECLSHEALGWSFALHSTLPGSKPAGSP